MIKKVFTVAVLVLSSNSFAGDLIVTTEKDEVVDNDVCSLREAVDLINGGTLDTENDCYPEKNKENNNKPSPIIDLDADKTYVLDKEIVIKKTAIIQSDKFNDFANQDNAKSPIIQTKKSRAFVIDDGSSFKQNTTVSLKGLSFQGAFVNQKPNASTDVTVDEGGLIYNREVMRIEKVRFSGGAAQKGGAIYNASLDASLSMKDVEFYRNYASMGSALYSERIKFNLINSLIHENAGLTTGESFTIYTAAGNRRINSVDKVSDDAKNNFAVLNMSKVFANVIFYQNKNTAFNLKDGMFVNNITVINNQGGIYLDSTYPISNDSNVQIIASRVANSVVLGNTDYDIKAVPKDYTYINHVVANQLIGLNKAYTESITQVSQDNVTDLLATNAQNPKVCRAPQTNETTGLFCPLIKLEGDFVPTLKPRLLMSYDKISDSPIVNKGATPVNTSSNKAQICEVTDIREETRNICDIGAFELLINTKNTGRIKTANDEIEYGETAKITLKDSVGDGQLLPKSLCDQYLPNARTDHPSPNLWLSGEVGKWEDGCLLFLNELSIPTKGKLTLADTKDYLVYTPNRKYHGFDDFEFEIISTTTRFSESKNDRSIRVRSIVRQFPPDSFDSKTTDIGYGQTSKEIFGSGSTGLGGLLGLAFLALIRRRSNAKK